LWDALGWFRHESLMRDLMAPEEGREGRDRIFIKSAIDRFVEMTIRHIQLKLENWYVQELVTMFLWVDY
jgi:hypothetical protein